MVHLRYCSHDGPLNFQENEVRCDTNLLPRIDLTDNKGLPCLCNQFGHKKRAEEHKAMEWLNYLNSGWVHDPHVMVLVASRVILVGKVYHCYLIASVSNCVSSFPQN